MAARKPGTTSSAGHLVNRVRVRIRVRVRVRGLEDHLRRLPSKQLHGLFTCTSLCGLNVGA
jgi:hypothetical protein